MKSIAFAAALIVCINAAEWQQQHYRPVTKVVQRPASLHAASASGLKQNEQFNKENEKIWGRDQILLVGETYGKTNAKSYEAESYDEWDMKDNDKWGAQAWGKDRDAYGASS